MKDFGFGKQSLETTVNNEIDLITDTFLDNEGEDYLLSQDFSVPIINILWQLIAGYRFTKENDHGLRVVESVNEAFATGFKSAIYPLWFQKVHYFLLPCTAASFRGSDEWGSSVVLEAGKDS